MNSEYVFVDDKGQEIKQDQLGGQSPYASSKSDRADLFDKIKPDDIVEVLRHRLMGEELLNGQWVKIKGLQYKAVSYACASDVTTLMLAVSSRNVSLSRLKDHEIATRTRFIICALMEMILTNWELYGIKTTDQISFIHQIVMSNTFITLKQSENAGLRAFLQGTTSESRVVNNQEKETGGWFSFRKR